MKILESNDQIRQLVYDEMLKALNNTARKSIPNILDRTKTIVEDAIKKSPEYASLIGGKLQGSLGVVDPEEALGKAINVWLGQIVCKLDKFRFVGNEVRGAFKLEIIETDKSQVIDLSTSSYVTEKGDKIPWMEWLLTAGNNTIVLDYIAVTGNFKHIPQSRTGLGLMIRKVDRAYKVPAEFAGDKDDNFVTRALEPLVEQIEKIIIEEFQHSWQTTP